MIQAGKPDQATGCMVAPCTGNLNQIKPPNFLCSATA